MDRWITLRGLEAGHWRRQAEDADAARDAAGGEGGHSINQDSGGAKPEVSRPAWERKKLFVGLLSANSGANGCGEMPRIVGNEGCALLLFEQICPTIYILWKILSYGGFESR